ncbi:MAG: transcriptional regulator, partial [Rhodobacterales bacterium 32-66-9]
PDLAGLYITGGGISGAIAALRAHGTAGKMVVIGDELTNVTRTALLDGTLTLVISHPLDRMSRDLIRGMVKATTNRHGGNWSSVTPFDMHNRENI